MHRVCCSLLFAGLFWLAIPAVAADSPVGTWNQVDDDSGKVTSVIRITRHGDELRGKVLAVRNMTQEQIDRDGKPPKCTQCEGQRHNEPIVGMTVLWGLTQHGSEWSGGHILDPAKGKVYKAKLELTDGGEHLEVRGYVGVSLFGRTQTWERVDNAQESQPRKGTD